jgi:hypothetical protein
MWLVVDSENVPNFNRNERKFYVNSNWADNRWNNTAMVAFRDCSGCEGYFGAPRSLDRLYPAT